jgi:hypothetical protein
MPERRTIQISRILLRTAVEMAAQEASRAEIRRQIEAQLPGCSITVGGGEADWSFTSFPKFEIPGHRVEWVD